MCTPCALLPAPRLITGTGSVSVRYSADLLGRHLAHDREAARVHHGHGIVDQLLGAVGGLALGEETAELRHAHRRDADMSLHRNPGLDDGLDVLAWCWLPSHFMTSAFASCTKRPAFSTACSGETWKLQYGMSTMRSPYWLPRSMALAIIMTSSKVTVTVLLMAEQNHAAGVGDTQNVDAQSSAMTALR